MTTILAVDLGKTGCRGSLRVDRRQVDRAEAAGAPGLAHADGVGTAIRAIRMIVDRIMPRDRAFTLSIGAAGAASAPDAANRLASELLRVTGVREVAVTSDAVTAHAGALGGACGVVLAVGTGVVATAVAESGRFTRVDGWGPLLGDEGSGAWIGGEGLRAALRAHDGRGPSTALATEVVGHFGIALDNLPKLLGQQENSAAFMAKFAPVVAAAATSDPVAKTIMTGAAHALARTVRAAVERAELPTPTPYAIIGGLIGLGPTLLEPLHAAIAEVVEHRRPLGDPIDGAALLAANRTTAFESLISRATSARELR